MHTVLDLCSLFAWSVPGTEYHDIYCSEGLMYIYIIFKQFFFVVKKVNCMYLNNVKKMNFLIVAESSFDDGLAFRCGLKNEHQRNYREVSLHGKHG